VSGQTWHDQTSGDYDMFLGDAVGAAADDPTFVGTTSVFSKGTYWDCDEANGEHFSYDSAAETWQQNLHKNNQSWGMACWYRSALLDPGDLIHFATCDTFDNTDIGLAVMHIGAASDRLVIHISNGGATLYCGVSFIGTEHPANTWSFLGFSATIASNVLTVNICNSTALSNGTAPATTGNPTASNMGDKLRINADAGGSSSIDCRRGPFAMWSGAAPTANQFAALRSLMSARFNEG
jgi:hypothetical protein